MPVTLEVTIAGLPELEAQLSAAPEMLAAENRVAMGESIAVAEAEIKSRTPRKTGRLFSAWTPHVDIVGGEVVGVLADDVEYAPFVEVGTGPHEIEARGRALMIPVASGGGFGGGRLSGAPRSGQQVSFFKRVHHPGSKGVHMAEEGLEAARAGITQAFLNAINRVLATIKGIG